jgi:hypothetical protein
MKMNDSHKWIFLKKKEIHYKLFSKLSSLLKPSITE